jgi:hypothetical protein
MKDGFVDVDLASFTSGNSGFIIKGAESYAYLGHSVSGAGDVNGDGYADVIVGVPDADSNGLLENGAAYVIFGMQVFNPLFLCYIICYCILPPSFYIIYAILCI